MVPCREYGHTESLHKLTSYATVNRQLFWLNRAADLGDQDALYQLALASEDETEQKRLLLKAAENEHIKSQFWLGLNAKDDKERIQWLSAASHQDYLPAQIALYQLWLLRGDFEKAMPWLESTADSEAESSLILGRYYWKSGDYQKSKDYFLQARTLGSSQAKQLLNTIEHYWWEGNKSLEQTAFSRVPENRCSMQIQPLVNSLDGMMKVLDLKSQYAKDRRLESLSICINEPIWVPKKQLACSSNWQNQGRLGCDLAYSATKLDASHFTHLLVIADEGKANVNNGVLYLDLVDTYDVFVHELAHFVGFADEYPLSESLAERICQVGNAPPNLVLQAPFPSVEEEQLAQEEANLVSDEEVLAEEAQVIYERPTLDLSYWERFGQTIELSRARTCNNHENQAFKASHRLTFMEYYDTKYIPPLYLAMWEEG